MSEKPKSVEGATDFSILDLAYGRQVQAKIHHHTLAYHIFSWSSTILLAMLGFAVSQGQHFRTQDRWFLTCAVLVLAFVVSIWQRRNHIEAQEHADNVTRIETLLHLKDSQYWGGNEPIIQKSPSKHPKLEAKVGILGYTIATLMLTVIVVVALWR